MVPTPAPDRAFAAAPFPDLPRSAAAALDNGIWFEGSLVGISVTRKKLAGRPVEELTRSDDAWLTDAHPGGLPRGEPRAIIWPTSSIAYGHAPQPISDVLTQHRSVSSCHLCNIVLRLGRPLTWTLPGRTSSPTPRRRPC